jgi:hypothetical protein
MRAIDVDKKQRAWRGLQAAHRPRCMMFSLASAANEKAARQMDKFAARRQPCPAYDRSDLAAFSAIEGVSDSRHAKTAFIRPRDGRMSGSSVDFSN